MRSKLLVGSIAIAVLGIAACGSSKKSSSSTAASPPPATAPATTTPAKGKKGKKGAATVPSRTYSLKLTGKAETPPGAPKGSGSAVVTLHGKTSQVCWRFSHLHGVVSPTMAHIHLGAKGTAGNIVVALSTGSKLVTKGCVGATSTLIKAIERNPHGYYVNIHSTKYPGGAVRSQL